MAPPDLSRLLFGASEVISEEDLVRKLERGRPLRVKLGLDPTAPHVTLGWAVVLRKLRQFQDVGHTAVLIVGDFTARVGDPSGKSETRPRLSAEAVRANADRVLGQFGRILSEERLEIRYNSEWLERMSMEDVLRLTASYTVARMLERDDFALRYREQRPISIMEFLYPLLQAMDSVAVEADIELGGHDQLFNLLVGRHLQREYEQEPQVVLTMPLLIGLDGTRAMGQSLGNYVGIEEPPDQMFGKLMSIPDHLIVQYLTLCTDLPPDEIRAAEAGLAGGSRHPAEEKRRMAREVVSLYHGREAARDAEEAFNRVHRDRELPEEVPAVPLPAEALRNGKVSLPHLLFGLGLADSNSHARRLIEGRGIQLDGKILEGVDLEVDPGLLIGRVLSRGRRKFVRILPPQG
jgi:tyrosyl-tRNA synthetase